jgi:hypothetical protein
MIKMTFDPVDRIIGKGKQGGTLKNEVNFNKKLLSEEYKKEKEEEDD